MTGAIVLNGEKYNGDIVGDFIISADGGYDKCEHSDLTVGDMDSVQRVPDGEIIKLDRDKDWTDGEYAVRLMMEKGVDTVNIYGLDGGRLDHILANIGLMSQLVEQGIRAVCFCNNFVGYMIDGELRLDNVTGKTISLSPYSDSVHIIYMEGFKWCLHDKVVRRNMSLTMSNVAMADKITIDVRGQLFVIVNN